MTKMTLDPLDVSFKNNLNKPVHRWYRFHAGCSSDFPQRIIEKLQIVNNSVILDPFSGSGTILISAKDRGVNSVGFDINPFCVFLSRVKTFWDFDTEELAIQIKSLERELKEILKDRQQDATANVPSYIHRYFSLNVLSKLSIIKKKVLTIRNEKIRDLLLLTLVSILIDVSKVHYVGETIVFDKKPKKNVSVYRSFIQKAREMYSDLQTKHGLKDSATALVYEGDVRDLDRLVRDGEVDYVITHPPYLNNYNYLLHDRLPLYFMEFLRAPFDEKRLRERIIGSVINNNSMDEPTSISNTSNKVERIVRRVKKTGDLARYKAVSEYFNAMNCFLMTVYDKLRRNGYCALLVGNSYVRGVMIPLDNLIVDIAKKIGFKDVKGFKVRDRGDGAFQHIYNGELYESIVLMKRS